ncbi:MAG: hypothetical protein JWN40_5211 [Phycisphaerales bacterium]|nr:hypothetical protein [Phycisphaerales bacterium]
MKAALLIFLFSSGGHWFADREGVVSVRWAANAPMPAADLAWELTLGAVRLAGDRVALQAGDRVTEIRVPCPGIRAHTSLNWTYRVIGRADGKELDSGTLPVYVYPTNLTEHWAERVGRRSVMVCDVGDGLPKLLAAARVPHERVDDGSKLRGPQADVLLVGPDMLGRDPLEQTSFLALARGGASVMIFRQGRPESLAGFEVVHRAAPKRFEWLVDHPLLAETGVGAGPSLPELASADLMAVRLPAGAEALELGWWPTESRDPSRAVPIDALLVTQAVGKGRVVLCQIPLGDWQTDPRSQILLGNALDYLLTPVEPTPPRDRRGAATRPAPIPTSSRTILIPSGDKP